MQRGFKHRLPVAFAEILLAHHKIGLAGGNVVEDFTRLRMNLIDRGELRLLLLANNPNDLGRIIELLDQGQHQFAGKLGGETQVVKQRGGGDAALLLFSQNGLAALSVGIQPQILRRDPADLTDELPILQPHLHMRVGQLQIVKKLNLSPALLPDNLIRTGGLGFK